MVLWKIKVFYRAIACAVALEIPQCKLESNNSQISTQMECLINNKFHSRSKCLEGLLLFQMVSQDRTKIVFFVTNLLLVAKMNEDKR